MFGIPEWAIGVGFIMIAVSVARALSGAGERQRGRKASRRDLTQAVEELRRKVDGGAGAVGGDTQARLDELEDVQRRLSDLEERMDFAERMLAKQRDAERIAPPKS
ncbi:MAG TPA: hypothetical protein VM716_03760 [Gemmatimonadales bacterium]|nr:hypothetical protein [Gemmatimonadales bacterium]